jgi:hypothetical protein
MTMAPSALGELELVTASDVARMVGCTRQNVSKLARKSAAGVSRSGFPAPAITYAAGALWSREAVERWAESRQKQARRNGAADAHEAP